MEQEKNVWNEEKIEELKRLSKNNRPREIAAIMGIGKNSVVGKLYRIKVKNGYVPPADSKHTNRHYSHSRRVMIGKRKCNTCEKDFEFHSHYQRFCDECKRIGRVT